MISVLVSGSSGPCSSPDIVVCSWARHYSHSASLHAGVQMGTGEFNAGVILRCTSIPSRGE